MSSKGKGKKFNYKSKPTVNTMKSIARKEIEKATEDKQMVFDMRSVYNAIGSSWIETSLCNPSQGTANNARIGTRIRIKSVEIKGVFAAGASETSLDDPYNVVRVILGLFRGNATTPLQTGGIGLNSILRTDFNSARGLLVKKYLDKYIPLQVTSNEKGGGDGYAAGLKEFKYYKKFKKPINVFYSDNTATYPSQQLFLSMLSDSGAVVNPGVVAGWMCVSFEDA